MTLEARELTVRRRGRNLVDALSLTTTPGEMVAVLGPNGAGKSTLLACLGGDLTPDDGEVRLRHSRSITVFDQALSLCRPKRRCNSVATLTTDTGTGF